MHKKAFLIGGGVGCLAGGLLGLLFGFPEEGIAACIVFGWVIGEIIGLSASR